ncbi:tetratricopeptide repeat protein [Geothrix sp. PMB-07]|uniref:O-linked N-acetylglucosamine transferase, SPINDLY family protein n=1 Tax=Geothrix sp. PMB-07 TaxID=3068640 RepID=UPI002740BBBA|nr:tetratricopeptide repeat protein [Geothrix sp. PMB-07]WLT31804.1 tetratricopeptide repeat protein [Geothrix sp. PMB-07]
MEEATALAKAGRWREAAEAFAALSALGESSYDLHVTYGTALMRCNRYEAARDQLEAALRLQPSSLEALNNLAGTNLRLGDPCAAEQACRLILAAHPEDHAAWTNLGLALSHQGRVSEGLDALQQALALAPEDRLIRDNLLLHLNYVATNGADLAHIHFLLCGQLPSSPPKRTDARDSRRIRIGYVSGDFRSHSVSFFMAPIIHAHDRSAFEVFCYSTTHAPDQRTESFRHLADHFIDLSTTTAAEAARHIEKDHIDILVDLGGHTSGNRLDIFALRPAPIQVTYLGYPATTGCPFMDVRLVDSLTDPEGSEPFSSERLVRLPEPFLCYDPHPVCPDVAPLPALDRGFITFGSFNHSSKISEDTLDLWSQVLVDVPDSRLFLKARAFSNAAVRELYVQRFAQRGIAADRLTLAGHTEGAQDHLSAYGKVDIALDTYPYHGTTTTCEALWMGVPVISLVGNLHAARVGLSILSAVDLDGLAVSHAEEYVALAAGLSEDLDQLATLRMNLRGRVARSPLCDRTRFTKGLEQAYREMLQIQF